MEFVCVSESGLQNLRPSLYRWQQLDGMLKRGYIAEAILSSRTRINDMLSIIRYRFYCGLHPCEQLRRLAKERRLENSKSTV